MALNLKRNIDRPDDFYQELLDMQRGMEEEDVQVMNAKLILILSNHIGDHKTLSEAMSLAKN
ncbi:hypothetical protein MNBD_ALPHA03-2131 [hydrothermal vent metagenome]|uniref:DUF2783 domain-containing protein n=1 Tax=hydrothermal vent metagenome TaxID=652676 RepID=A0A3B1BA09_9ZZZZ|nr:DUF2783 domain-containing protein [Emcibacter sp.]